MSVEMYQGGAKEIVVTTKDPITGSLDIIFATKEFGATVANLVVSKVGGGVVETGSNEFTVTLVKADTIDLMGNMLMEALTIDPLGNENVCELDDGMLTIFERQPYV